MTTLTTRNLFDEIFSTIPEHLSLFRTPYEDEGGAAAEGSSASPDRDADHEELQNAGTGAGTSTVTAIDETTGGRRKAATGGLVMELFDDDETVVEAKTFHRDDEAAPVKKVATIGSKVAGDAAPDAMLTSDAAAVDRTNAPILARTAATASVPAREMSAEEQLRLMCPPASASSEEGDGSPTTFHGLCVLFNHAKGFGFISPGIGGPDIYVTRESIPFAFTEALLVEARTEGEVMGYDDGNASGQDGAVAAPSKSLSGVVTGDPVKQQHSLRLLLQSSKKFLIPGEAVEFQVALNTGRQGGQTNNRQNQNNRNSADRRRLRSFHITGPNGGPLQVERAVLGMPLLPTSDGAAGPAVPAAPPTREASRVPVIGRDVNVFTGIGRQVGTVRNFMSDHDRGYIRPSTGSGGDVLFYADAVVWTKETSVSDRTVREGMTVEYTIVGKERNNKPRAGLVTAVGGVPLSLHNSLKEGTSSGDADDGGYNARDDDGGLLDSNGGMLGEGNKEYFSLRSGGGNARKRQRGEGTKGASAIHVGGGDGAGVDDQQQVLLLNDDDIPW